MNETDSDSPGLLDSLRMLGDSLLATVHDRIELFSLEIEEERSRLILTIIWISLALFAGVMTALLASITLVFLFWETARLAVLLTLTVVYGSALAYTIVTVRRHLARQPRPFAASLAELEEDQACIRGKK
jgi:uncharacterized membrane protein YqjE